jgi:parallel beta-helix repeat protein
MKRGILCILICTLLISTATFPLSATTGWKQTSQSLTTGAILYVGGSGPNNYSKIQDAIDNATNGDTVFVFDDSSPYYENIIVEKSITIQGEDKETTIIDGSNISNGVDITANDVAVSGFTIQHCYNNEKFNMTSGILLTSTNNTITDNILLQNLNGISNLRSYALLPRLGFNTITNNQFIGNNVGIYFVNESDNTISKNIISQCAIGIMLFGALNTNISFNIISENGGGILMVFSSNTVIYRNDISYNKGGIDAVDTNADQILQNNFIGNTKHRATSSQQFFYKNLFFKVYFNVQYQRNVWNENYWDKPRSFPYIIFGLFKLTFCIDWHPAQEPYDISKMR